jgi:LVIVD repeat
MSGDRSISTRGEPVTTRRLAPFAAALLVACGESGTGPDGAVASLEIQPAQVPTLTALDDTVRLVAIARDRSGLVVPGAAISWDSRDPNVATVDDGLVTPRDDGDTFIVAQSGAATDSVRVVVDAPEVTALAILAPDEVRQGEVVRLAAVATLRAGGEDTLRSGVVWRLLDANVGFVRTDGRFVAFATGGTARITATAGSLSDTVDIPVRARGLAGSFSVVGNGSIPVRTTSDLWAYGGFAYTGTWGCAAPPGPCGDRLFAWDIGDPANLVLTDSVAVDARTVNDVKIRADGTLAVLSHENSLDALNGITLLDLADPLHPTVITRYSGECTTGGPTCIGGVHNVWIEGDFVYVVGSGVLWFVDISDPAQPQQLGYFSGGSSFVHDVYVRDGLAFVSHWNDGLIILDVGNGIRGGSPANPVEVSRIVTAGGAVHNAWYWPERGYVFVGQEIFGASPGRMRVVDVADLTAPVEVADFFLPGDPPHNFWVDEERGILFAAWYSNGARAIDVTGELLGDLTRQGREYAFSRPVGPRGPGRIWAPQWHNGLVFASDMDNGLWALQFVVE